jgi:hypothetical protein
MRHSASVAIAATLMLTSILTALLAVLARTFVGIVQPSGRTAGAD